MQAKIEIISPKFFDESSSRDDLKLQSLVHGRQITETPCQRKDNPAVGDTLGSSKITSLLAAVAETVMS